MQAGVCEGYSEKSFTGVSLACGREQYIQKEEEESSGDGYELWGALCV